MYDILIVICMTVGGIGVILMLPFLFLLGVDEVKAFFKRK